MNDRQRATPRLLVVTHREAAYRHGLTAAHNKPGTPAPANSEANMREAERELYAFIEALPVTEGNVYPSEEPR